MSEVNKLFVKCKPLHWSREEYGVRPYLDFYYLAESIIGKFEIFPSEKWEVNLDGIHRASFITLEHAKTYCQGYLERQVRKVLL